MNGGCERPEIDRQECRTAIEIAGAGHRQNDERLWSYDRSIQVRRGVPLPCHLLRNEPLSDDYWPEV
jgi:hypothetical protein